MTSARKRARLTVLGVLVAAGMATLLRPHAATTARQPQANGPVPAAQLQLASLPHRIVYESLREANGGANWEIALINADGSGMANLTNTPGVDEHYPHASPDGTRVLFIAIERQGRTIVSRAVYVMNLDGSGRTKIADNAYQPAWVGDGAAIAWLPGEFSRLSSSMTSNRGLMLYDVATKTSRRHPDGSLRMLYNLTSSPDARWFVATSRRGTDNLLIPAGAAGVRPLSIDGCRPDISPDGTRIAWGRTDHELRIGMFDPASRRNVTDQGPVVTVGRREKVYHVDWSPDGRRLAFSHGSSNGNQAVGSRAAGWNLAVYDLATRRWAHVTTDGRHNKEPDWVPVR
jgi:Tol biopolymer transport system component